MPTPASDAGDPDAGGAQVAVTAPSARRGRGRAGQVERAGARGGVAAGRDEPPPAVAAAIAASRPSARRHRGPRYGARAVRRGPTSWSAPPVAGEVGGAPGTAATRCRRARSGRTTRRRATSGPPRPRRARSGPTRCRRSTSAPRQARPSQPSPVQVAPRQAPALPDVAAVDAAARTRPGPRRCRRRRSRRAARHAVGDVRAAAGGLQRAGTGAEEGRRLLGVGDVLDAGRRRTSATPLPRYWLDVESNGTRRGHQLPLDLVRREPGVLPAAAGRPRR